MKRARRCTLYRARPRMLNGRPRLTTGPYGGGDSGTLTQEGYTSIGYRDKRRLEKEAMRMLKRPLLVLGLLGLLWGLVAAGEDDLRAMWGRIPSPEGMVEYRALPQYSEAPSLARLVEEGKLPPVEERLPDEPRVWKPAVMVDGPGVYGDIMRRTSGMEPEGWMSTAAMHAGWDGSQGFMNEGLLDVGLMWMLDEPEPIPNLATSYEWSEDGKTLTMYLMRGVRWSDGHEFTADDVLFTYYDIVLDPRVPSWQSTGKWTFGGEVAELEKIDDYTIRWHFAVPFPIQALWFMESHQQFSPQPAHVFRHYHPRHNPDKNYEDFLAAASPDRLPAVVLGAYVPVLYRPADVKIYVRNPYYYKVDELGQQLPYFDAVVWRQAADWSARDYDLLAGDCDVVPVQEPELVAMIYAASRAPDAQFRWQWGAFTIPYQVHLNLALYVGINDDYDLALRKLFRTLEFRQALAHLVDREGICEGVYPVPSVQPFYGAMPSGSAFYNEDFVVKYPYDPARAKELLAGLGFEDSDGDGFLNWPDDSLVPGERLLIELITVETEPEHLVIAEAMVPDFRDAGIDLRVRNLGVSIFIARRDAGEYDMLFGRSYASTPFLRPGELGPVDTSTPGWHKAGPDEKRDLLPFEQRIEELLGSVATMADAADRVAVFDEVAYLYTSNVYTVPILEMQYPMAIHIRHRNYPSDYPALLYHWYHNSVPIDIRWTPQELQLPSEDYVRLIPTAEVYEAQPWYRATRD